MSPETVTAPRARSAGPGTTNTMKAIRIHRQGGPEALVYEDAPVPALRPGDALVRVCAAGISPAEFTWRIYETPDGRSRLPKIPPTKSPASSPPSRRTCGTWKSAMPSTG